MGDGCELRKQKGETEAWRLGSARTHGKTKHTIEKQQKMVARLGCAAVVGLDSAAATSLVATSRGARKS
ncbi:hypothetical protein NL676_000611 [Syzygium grande]|nr:hypothetical protein NL676_000611 [Syzygium grande]